MLIETLQVRREADPVLSPGGGPAEAPGHHWLRGLRQESCLWLRGSGCLGRPEAGQRNAGDSKRRLFLVSASSTVLVLELSLNIVKSSWLAFIRNLANAYGIYIWAINYCVIKTLGISEMFQLKSDSSCASKKAC